MVAVRRQFKVSGIGKLLYLIVQTTCFAVLPVPQDQLTRFQSSDDVLPDHQDGFDLSFSDVEFLADHDQVKTELFRVVDEDGVGAFKEGFEGWMES